MPVINRVGISKYTAEKQRIFQKIISMHMHISNMLRKKYNGGKQYTYFDMNAGPGLYADEDGNEYVGSPVIAFQEAAAEGLILDYHFFESRKRSRKLLKKALGIEWVYRSNKAIEWCICNNLDGIDTKGLCYHDPNGDPDFSILRAVANKFRYVDILIYLSATTIKRVRSVYGKEGLIEKLASVSKKKWIVNKPSGDFQWVFIFGTNWEGYPEMKKLGFHDIRSPIGQDIINKLYMNEEEFKKSYTIKQPTLF